MTKITSYVLKAIVTSVIFANASSMVHAQDAGNHDIPNTIIAACDKNADGKILGIFERTCVANKEAAESQKRIDQYNKEAAEIEKKNQKLIEEIRNNVSR